jgi:Protein of unknown function (DUF3379)
MIVECSEFRRAFGANPNDTNASVQAHRAQCAACESYAQETLRLDKLIGRALHVPVKLKSVSLNELNNPDTNNVVALPVRPRIARWYAMAASVTVILSAAIVAVWLLSYSPETLAHDVVQHMRHEPDAMTPSETRVAEQLLEGALKAKGLQLKQPLHNVSYLQTCLIRGHLVPHLVMQTEQGPVTVLLLTEESVQTKQVFNEDNYHGTLVPMQHGAVAVIASDPTVVEIVAARVNAAMT